MCCRACKIKEWRSTYQHVPLVQQGLLLMCRRMKTLQSSSCRLGDLLLCPRSWDFCPQVLSAASACPRMQFALKFPNGHSLPSTIVACYLCADAVGYELRAELRPRPYGFVHWEGQSGQESAQLMSEKSQALWLIWTPDKNSALRASLPPGLLLWRSVVTETDAGLPCANHSTAGTRHGW